MNYDRTNIFAKILRGEIPCKKIYENDHVLAFYDVNPQKKIHALVVPKGEYVDLDDFNTQASDWGVTPVFPGDNATPHCADKLARPETNNVPIHVGM